MKNLFLISVFLIFIFSNCKNEFDEFSKEVKSDLRIPDLFLEFNLQNPPEQKKENCFDCEIQIWVQEPDESTSTCGEVNYSISNDILEIEFENDIQIQNLISVNANLAPIIQNPNFQFQGNILQIQIPENQIEGFVESGFNVKVELCKTPKPSCENIFSAFVEFPTQTIFYGYPNLQNQIPACGNDLCVEVENNYFSISSATVGICVISDVFVKSKMCAEFEPSNIEFLELGNNVEIRVYFSESFWDCWDNPQPNQEGAYSISMQFEHANPLNF